MKKAVCRVDGCERRVLAREMCAPHYQRNKIHGDPMAHVPIRVQDMTPNTSEFGPEFRVCRRCRKDKELEQFSPKGGGRMNCYCKPCQSEISSDWNKRNPDTTYGAHLKRNYGIDLQQYESMAEAQGGACKICFLVPEIRLNVHHNHDTGEVVGLICWNCNTGLGKFKDDPELLRRAALFHEGKL